MPDFDRLHEYAQRLADLTAPGQQEPGLLSWCMFVGEAWQEIARMWTEDPKRAAAPELYDALEAIRDYMRLPFKGVAALEAIEIQIGAALLKANPARENKANGE